MSTFTVPLLVLWLLSRWNARELRRGLRETNVQLELITSEADVALLMVDHQCRVCWINPETERLLGWKTDELVGANLHERTHMRNGEDLHPDPVRRYRRFKQDSVTAMIVTECSRSLAKF
jgi:PAS domain S-box-containing protein